MAKGDLRAAGDGSGSVSGPDFKLAPACEPAQAVPRLTRLRASCFNYSHQALIGLITSAKAQRKDTLQRLRNTLAGTIGFGRELALLEALATATNDPSEPLAALS